MLEMGYNASIHRTAPLHPNHLDNRHEAAQLLLTELAKLIPSARLLRQPAQLAPYESDALTAHRADWPFVRAETQEEVIATVRARHRYGVPFAARAGAVPASPAARCLWRMAWSLPFNRLLTTS